MPVDQQHIGRRLLRVDMLEKLRSQIIRLPRNWKKGILIALDVCILTFALWASFGLRLDRWTLPQTIADVAILLSAPAVAVPVFIRTGLYRAVVRYLPERALWTMIQSVALAVLLWVFVAFLSQMMGQTIIPRSVPVIYWAIASIILATVSRRMAPASGSADLRCRRSGNAACCVAGQHPLRRGLLGRRSCAATA